MSELSLWGDMPQQETAKPEKTRKSCKYSEVQVPLTSRQLDQCEYVQCPECKSIRTVSASSMTGKAYFPWHKPPTRIQTTANRWWREEMFVLSEETTWSIVTKG